jgi:photosystem II stability/assembly factor-like uncharacterized protein
MGTSGWYDSTLAVDPSNANIVYAGGSGIGSGGIGIIGSTDGGASWTDISNEANGTNGPHANHHGIGFDANGKLLVGTDGGIWRLDAQSPPTWSDLNGNLDTVEFNSIALDPTNPAIAFGGSQGNGTAQYTGDLGWSLVRFNSLGDSGVVQIDQSSPSTIYQSFRYALPDRSLNTSGFLERSDDGGLTWTSKTSGINLTDKGADYVPFVIDPTNSSRLILGTDHLYESTDRGDSWHPIGGPGATGWTATTPINAITIAPSDPHTIYATAPGFILVTFNDGVSWQDISLNIHMSFGQLAVDPTNNLTAYIVRRQYNGTETGHVFKTINGGTNWTDITGNLPDLPTHSIVLDPRNGAIFVGTDAGVYASDDGGTTWNRYGSGMANAQVVDPVLNTTTGLLAAGTHGRGMWEILVPGAPALSAFHVMAPSSASAGTAFSITVLALDQFGGIFSRYNGTVHFASTDAGAVLPSNSMLTNGTGTFTVTLATVGNQSITATDTASSIADSSGLIAVSPSAATHFAVSAPAGVTAGTFFTFTVTAR